MLAYFSYRKFLVKCCILVACILLGTSSCSVYEKRIYSEPIDHLQANTKNTTIYRINHRLQTFEQAEIATTFVDSISKTVVSITLNNEYRKGLIGPALIPLIPIYTGYGYAHKINKSKDENGSQLIMELTISPGKNDIVSFVPSFFSIYKKRSKDFAKLVAVDDIKVLSDIVYCKEKHTWKLVFNPGVRAAELPRVDLRSLKINNQEFHPEGIFFKIGRKSFYSPLVLANG